jgi:catechol 2,3-dioxygenase-like lactoylglutathione lyase family enzyme
MGASGYNFRMPPTPPRLFRLILPVSDGEKAVAFYSRLLGLEARSVGGGRHYFDCGPVILALLETQKPAHPETLFFAVADLEEVHARARDLGCLSQGLVHGASGAEILTRPWGERSFYAVDPCGHQLCFVDETTLYTGR